MAAILATGIATLDIINVVDRFPTEDDEIRALSQRITRGGNASNTLCVLSQLGHQVDLAAMLINEADSQLIEADLSRYQINTRFCPRLNGGKMPTSYITLNQQNGSRTIIHYRDCPELSFESFLQIDLTSFDWIHFEGRNGAELIRMLQHCGKQYPAIPVSLEIEKPRDGIENLFELADWLFFSKSYVQSKGFDCANDWFATLDIEMNATCTWGADGAYGWQNGEVQFVSAPRLDKVVDSLGAGDTFNAGMIHSLLAQKTLQDSLQFASQLAGHKCRQPGFANLLNTL